MENGPWQTPLVHSAVVASQRTLAWGSVATRDSALRASSVELRVVSGVGEGRDVGESCRSVDHPE
eukprot:3748467-Prymnesium_polylepis.1